MILTRLVSPKSIRRRMAAILAAVCLVSVQAELWLPDQHDGDAPAAQEIAGAGHHHATESPAGAQMPAPGHSAHIDHCAHAHVFASVTCAAAVESISAERKVPETTSLRLASIAAAPHRRPPIA